MDWFIYDSDVFHERVNCHIIDNPILDAIIYIINNSMKKIDLLKECVKVLKPAHQVLPLTGYIFEVINSTSATQANKI